MCGIIGYIGKRTAVSPIIDGLKRLEYRGYDSAGIATINKGKISIAKCKGRVCNLEKILKKRKLSGNIGVGHTRWATHGKPSKINAHPHLDQSGKIIVVHNGIIENFAKLKRGLEKDGFTFKTQTDTEVIAHLIGKYYRGNIKEAVIKTVRFIKGSYALGILCLDEADKIIAVRCNSPLAIGLGRRENFIASDVSAVLNYTRRVVYLRDNKIAVVTADTVNVFGLNGKALHKNIDIISRDIEKAQKGSFRHFMLKEIHEQPEVLLHILSYYVKGQTCIKFDDIGIEKEFLKKIENIIILGCGTAYHAGLIGKYIFESLVRIPALVDVGSEFRYRNPVIRKNTLAIVISQSGETADTLASVREARKNNAKVLSICNILGSSLTRESDATIYTQAGPEISVAATKTYTAQLAVLYLLGLYLADLKKNLSKKYIRNALASLKKIPSRQKKILENSRDIKAIAEKHVRFGAFLYLGRNINFPTALEGALKLKEISYIPSEGYAAGEMKHGSIALIDEYRAVVCIANDSLLLDKMISNIQEIVARRGKIIAIVTEGNKYIKEYVKEVVYIPKTEDIFSPLLTIIPLQLLAYFIAMLKGYDVDRPRNLAKSVTVE